MGDSYTEKDLYRELLIGMRGVFGTSIDLCRHEDRVTPGVPDVSYGLNNACGWLELKTTMAACRSPTTTVRARFEPQQVSWLERRAAAGCYAFVLCRIGFHDDPGTALMLVRGTFARRLKEGQELGAMVSMAVATYWSPHNPGHWRALGGYLTTHQ